MFEAAFSSLHRCRGGETEVFRPVGDAGVASGVLRLCSGAPQFGVVCAESERRFYSGVKLTLYVLR